MTLAKAVGVIKANSSRWVKGQRVKDFEWQQGYGGFSVSASKLEPVIKYIQNQDPYHKTRTFRQEFVALLKKHGVEYDPRYILD